MKSILFLTPYPEKQAASQRFRFEQYLDVLEKNGLTYEIQPFILEKGWTKLYTNGNLSQKIQQTTVGFLRRIILLFRVSSFQVIFIHREATPLGPPVCEWIISKIFKKRIVYDFDDAIWLHDANEKGKFLTKLKWKSKVKHICKWSYKISAGNEMLADYARQFNKNVVINPTTIDTEHYHNPTLYKKKKNDPLVVGWTGTHSTLPYLNELIPVIKELEKHYFFKFLIISNRRPELDLQSLEYRSWSKETEIVDLMTFDIGVMPLTDDNWSKGKCGFKILQYMALEIPVLASPVGVNKTIVENGLTGFTCLRTEDWINGLADLINDEEKRRKIGKSSRKEVVNNYSIQSNVVNFLSLFDL